MKSFIPEADTSGEPFSSASSTAGGVLSCNADKYDGSALFVAAINGHPVTTKKLLKALGMDAVNRQNDAGNTALMCAVMEGHLKIVDLLLEKEGIDLDARNEEGMSATAYAISRKHVAILDRLLKAGANANAVDKFGDAMIFQAIAACDIEILKTFLESGKPDLNVTNMGGHIPLVAASRSLPAAMMSTVLHMLILAKTSSVSIAAHTASAAAVESAHLVDVKLAPSPPRIQAPPQPHRPSPPQAPFTTRRPLQPLPDPPNVPTLPKDSTHTATTTIVPKEPSKLRFQKAPETKIVLLEPSKIATVVEPDLARAAAIEAKMNSFQRAFDTFEEDLRAQPAVRPEWEATFAAKQRAIHENVNGRNGASLSARVNLNPSNGWI